MRMVTSPRHHSILRRLPLPDYHKTRLWARSLRPPRGRVADWPYYRCIELATRSFATAEGYGVAFPGAGDPAKRYTMLEFGVANGHTFEVLLHFRDAWLRRLCLRNPVLAIGFDTFEGLPSARAEDTAAPWREGDFPSDRDALQRQLAARFVDFELVKGLFSVTLPTYEELLREQPPVFVSVDCDYYSSTVDVFQTVLEVAPHGCLFYFDDVEATLWSDRLGELRAIAEVNEGRFGEHLQLVEFPLWIETGEIRHYKKVYRLVNLERAEAQMTARDTYHAPERRRLSPL